MSRGSTMAAPDEQERQVLPRDSPIVTSLPFRLGRALFGGVLTFMAMDNLVNLEERIGYAESKDAPYPEVSVPTSSVGLLLGGIGVTLWRLPAAAAAGIAWFFITVTPVMHDFWNVDDPEQKQQQMIHFMKNVALLGAAFALTALGRRRG